MKPALVGALIALALVGCGDDDDGGGEATQPNHLATAFDVDKFGVGGVSPVGMSATDPGPGHRHRARP